MYETLHVKYQQQIQIKTGAINDTLESWYDHLGRLTSYKNRERTDSIFYKNNRVIEKRYMADGMLNTITTLLKDKKGNTIKLTMEHFSPKYVSGYEARYKKGKIISIKYFNEDHVRHIYNEEDKKQNSINYFENDTTYSYTLNNYELIHFYDDVTNQKEMGAIAFDDSGKIIWSLNYVHNKPNEVINYVRSYDVENKTYTEFVNKDYYDDNGLLRRSENNEHNTISIYYYEFH